MLEVVVQEILQDKITFDISGGPVDLESTPGSLL
jgi:hypothetical protein